MGSKGDGYLRIKTQSLSFFFFFFLVFVLHCKTNGFRIIMNNTELKL